MKRFPPNPCPRFYFYFIFIIYLKFPISCPAGLRVAGGTCVNIDECLWFPCQNGGKCRDHHPPRKYECHCPMGYTGMNCELELLASGVLTPSRDFVIALVLCVSSLICKYIFLIEHIGS